MEQNTLEKDQLSYQTLGRLALEKWRATINENVYTSDVDFQQLVKFHFANNFAALDRELTEFGQAVSKELEPLVAENNRNENLPQLRQYNALGARIDTVIHHPTYVAAGNIIYQSKLLARMSKAGGLSECLLFLFLSSQTGEAGHNCPIACSAGIIRVLQRIGELPNKDLFLKKLTLPSFSENFTGAQFLTEIQGGSDVGLNAVFAKQSQADVWRIYGDKWFCSNANADLLFVTARYNLELPGTKGLALFLVPARWQEEKNNYIIHRLKDKLGTRSMATGEIEFQGAYAWPVGTLETGFHLAMDQVLHTSRLFNSVCVISMARRAYHIALAYAKERVAFGQPIINYALVKENLAIIKAENTAMLAAIFATAKLQDEADLQKESANKNDKPSSRGLSAGSSRMLLRVLVNMQKYFTAKHSVEHIHHALDVLAGNGTIETFSPIPRLLRDCLICENWEGTHNVIQAQMLKDLLKYNVDTIYLDFIGDEIQKLRASQTYFVELTAAEKRLRDDFARFKDLPRDLQSLLIKDLVDQMAELFCAVMLLKEAQAGNDKSKQSKLSCYRLFQDRYLTKKVTRDETYLKLMTEIVMS